MSKNDLEIKTYLRIKNLFHGDVSIRPDWWLATALIEAARGLYIFARGVEYNVLTISIILPIVLLITLLMRIKIFFWIGFILSILSLIQTTTTIAALHNTEPNLHYEALVLQGILFLSYYLLFRQIRKNK